LVVGVSGWQVGLGDFSLARIVGVWGRHLSDTWGAKWFTPFTEYQFLGKCTMKNQLSLVYK
jgi:hypothetical protein